MPQATKSRRAQGNHLSNLLVSQREKVMSRKGNNLLQTSESGLKPKPSDLSPPTSHRVPTKAGGRCNTPASLPKPQATVSLREGFAAQEPDLPVSNGQLENTTDCPALTAESMSPQTRQQPYLSFCVIFSFFSNRLSIS